MLLKMGHALDERHVTHVSFSDPSSKLLQRDCGRHQWILADSFAYLYEAGKEDRREAVRMLDAFACALLDPRMRVASFWWVG